MRTPQRLPALLSLICVGILSYPCLADEEHDLAAQSAAMSARVDELLAQKWADANVQPIAADDAAFLRRASLDLTGVIPSVAEARAFLGDTRPDKRARLIDALLEKPAHATHLANTWRGLLLPGEVDLENLGGSVGFQSWLREEFVANTRYDNLVADLLVASGGARQTGPALFYSALQLKPEEAAASTSRIFLGVQIQCAQCHDHPYDRWTKQDFWGYAAFFARLQRRSGQRADLEQVEEAAQGELREPDSGQVVAPKYLDAKQANPAEDYHRRRQLAIWLVSRDNPFFARASVNRVWAQLFGRGLVDPVDDFSPRNPPSHPELLDELTAFFVSTGFDLRELFRTLAKTQAYGLSSEHSDEMQPPPELFALMAIKTLTPDQLYDSLNEATRRREAMNAIQRAIGANGSADPNRLEFVARFQAPGQNATEFQFGVPQALTLINGRAVAEATDLQQSPLLGALEAPFLSDEQRVEVLFLSTLTRPASEAERTLFVGNVHALGASADRRQPLADALWALLNSAEFMLNH